MKHILINKSKNLKLSSDVELAKTFYERSLGLLGRNGLTSDQCMWIHKCNCIHTFFMKFSIDVVYVDQNLKIMKIDRNIKPWRISWGGFKTQSCFEFQANQLNKDLMIGDVLSVST